MNNRSVWISSRSVVWSIITVVIIAVIVYVMITLHNIEASKVEDQSTFIPFVKAASPIDQIVELGYFVEEKSYDVAYGTDEADKQYIAINPTGNQDKDKLVLLKKADIYSIGKIEKDWQSACNGCTLKKSSPAILDDQPVWELTYLDKDEKYVMEYFSLKDGTTYEKLQLSKK